MKIKALIIVLAIGLIGISTFAAPTMALPKTYQVTGPVTAVTADVITVKKGADLWEIAKDASTKTTGNVAVGETVTITYRMSATSIEVKPKRGR